MLRDKGPVPCLFLIGDGIVQHFHEFLNALRNLHGRVSILLIEEKYLLRPAAPVKQIAAAVSRKEDLVPLLIAYYFKTYGIWETSDYLSRQSVQHCIDTDTADEHCHRIARKFLRWLENVFVRRYMRYVYSVIHYVLYTRLWEFDDYLEYNAPHPEETLSRLRRDVRTAGVEI